jgi:hypothetical protein
MRRLSARLASAGEPAAVRRPATQGLLAAHANAGHAGNGQGREESTGAAGEEMAGRSARLSADE